MTTPKPVTVTREDRERAVTHLSNISTDNYATDAEVVTWLENGCAESAFDAHPNLEVLHYCAQAIAEAREDGRSEGVELVPGVRLVGLTEQRMRELVQSAFETEDKGWTRAWGSASCKIVGAVENAVDEHYNAIMDDKPKSLITPGPRTRKASESG